MNKTGMIFSGGDIEDSFALEQFKRVNPDLVIGVDKGISFLYRNQIMPHMIVGDFDSVDGAVIDSYRGRTDVIIREFQPEKDASDTEIAVQAAMELGIQELHLLGATGTRQDHVMANLQILRPAFYAGMRAYILDPHNKIYLAEQKAVLKKSMQFGDYFSLFSFEGKVEGLSIKGAKYPLQDETLRPGSSRCVSNEIEAEEAVITWKQGLLIIMETRD